MIFLYCGQDLIRCGMRRSPSLHSFLSSVYCDLLCMTRTHFVMISLASIHYHWRVLRKVNNIVCVCVCVCVSVCVCLCLCLCVCMRACERVCIYECSSLAGGRLSSCPLAHSKLGEDWKRHHLRARHHPRGTPFQHQGMQDEQCCRVCTYICMCACTPAYVICVFKLSHLLLRNWSVARLQ